MKNMLEIQFTNHAKKRCQQRGIPITVVKFIVENGSSVRTHGDKKHFINKSKLKKLQIIDREFIKKNDKHILNTAVVTNRSTIISCMKITKNVKWN